MTDSNFLNTAIILAVAAILVPIFLGIVIKIERKYSSGKESFPCGGS